jgi:hypothetical protein
MHYNHPLLQPPGKYLAPARCHLCVSARRGSSGGAREPEPPLHNITTGISVSDSFFGSM